MLNKIFFKRKSIISVCFFPFSNNQMSFFTFHFHFHYNFYALKLQTLCTITSYSQSYDCTNNRSASYILFDVFLLAIFDWNSIVISVRIVPFSQSVSHFWASRFRLLLADNVPPTSLRSCVHCTCVYSHTHTHTHAHTHTHMYTHAHTCTCTHTHRSY